MSRRGALALVGGGALFVAALTAGQTIGGPLREWALLLPRSRVTGEGGNGFPINKTARAAGVSHGDTGADWRLVLAGPTPRSFTRDELLALEQHTAVLPDRLRGGLVERADLDRRAGPRPGRAGRRARTRRRRRSPRSSRAASPDQ